MSVDLDVFEEWLKAAILPEVYLSFEKFAETQHESTWSDVAAKAKRLVQQGRVTILRNAPTHIMSHVIGDGTDNDGVPDEHDVEISRHDPSSQIIEQWNCFTGDAPVTMANGSRKPISEIEVGDLVLTHIGEVRPVTNVWSKPYNGDLIRIRLSGISEEIVATSNHPFWVANEDYHHSRRNGWEGKYKSAHHQNRHGDGNVDYALSTKAKGGFAGVLLEPAVDWVDAEDLSERMYLSMAAPVDEAELEVEGVRIEGDVAYLIGWYIAEGFVIKSTKNRVGFALAPDEWHIAEDLSRICEEHFGTPGTIRRAAHTTDFRVSSPLLRKIVEKLVGTGSATKGLHSSIMRLPVNEQARLFDGWWQGDGSQDGNRRVLSTVSESLANQARLLLARAGLDSSVTWNDNNFGNGFVKNARRIYQIRWQPERKRFDPERFFKDGQVWMKIVSVDAEHYDGDVWDIEVAGDHSFQAYGVNVHNCTCAWAQFSFDRTRKWKKFEGRPCLIPGSLITLADGSYKPIEDVTIGDRVITHDGIGQVTNTMSRPYEGDVYQIYRMGYPDPIALTGNHEVWALSLPSRVRSAGDRGQERGQGFKISDSKCLAYEPEWIDAQDLRVHDWVASTWISEESVIPVDGLPTVLGYYLAEGNTAQKSVKGHNLQVQWTFHISEEHLADDLEDALRRMGFMGSVLRYRREDTHTLNVRISDAGIAAELERIAGRGSRTKRLAPEVMLWNCAALEDMIAAHHAGNGTVKKDGRYTHYTASPVLARQLFDILVKCGYVPSWTHGNNNGGPANREGKTTIERVQYIPAARSYSGRRRFDDYYLSKITHITWGHYSGLVYNLSVDNQESYVAAGVTNHNCSHVLATYWKARSTPLDLGEGDEAFQVPRGQKAHPPGQQKIPGLEPNTVPEGQRQFSPDEEGLPNPEQLDQMQQQQQQQQQQPQTQAVPPQALPSTQDLTLPKQPQSPFNTPKAQPPQHEQLHLFDITAPPGMQPMPTALPVSVPGGRPPTPGNPIGFPGTFSHFIPVLVVHSSQFVYGSDSLTEYFEAQRAARKPIYVAFSNMVALERSGGKIPVPGAQPYSTSSEGIPLYDVMDLGWNPTTQNRENADVNVLQGAPEQTGTYSDVSPGRFGEVIDFDPSLKMAYVLVPLNYPEGGDVRLHPHSLRGWVDYKDIRPISPARSPFRSGR